ncbi:hypothetical protein O3M35_012611 [Rhynocoris fuscipes]|uniref:RING-type domain-containing protein n=1 Tax=Rhynocoris fuscipes TaxID=488301 RepID=A0AAW1CUK4_9HEMI
MGFIEDELDEVRKLCEHIIPGSKLVSCVQSMVRVEIKRTSVKTIVACMQFPLEYPAKSILLELKSKTLSEKLLAKLTNVCDEEIKKYLGKPQILKILQFITNFIDENPLSCCYDEITFIKSKLTKNDELKLKQKSSKVYLKLNEQNYYINGTFHIPDDYPNKQVEIDVDTNLPPAISRYLIGESMEKARQCVEPPLRLDAAAKAKFVKKPSLGPATAVFLDSIRIIPSEQCQICHKLCLPVNPKDVVTDESHSLHVERMYCNHLFHLSCLIGYMKTPPFQGGKKCPTCGQKIYHEKWRVGEKLAEDRWAHQQARQRELDEVTDFFS